MIETTCRGEQARRWDTPSDGPRLPSPPYHRSDCGGSILCGFVADAMGARSDALVSLARRCSVSRRVHRYETHRAVR